MGKACNEPWSRGGFFPNGIQGFLMAFQMAIFSFIGIELIGITAEKLKPTQNDSSSN